MTDQDQVRESVVDEEGIVFQIREYDSFRESMRQLQETCNFVPDTSTDEGYAKSKEVAVGGRKIFNALEQARKDRKQAVLEEGRLIDSECKSIQDMITAAIGPHLLAYKEVDNRKRKEKEERAARVQKKIDDINGLVVAAPNMEPDDIYRMIEDLKNDPLDEGFGGRLPEVMKAVNNTVSILEAIGKTKLQEEENARIAHEQELERQRQEEEDRKRREAEDRKREEEDAKRALELAEQKRKEEELAERERKLAEQELAARDAELEKEREAQAEKERKEQAEREEQIRKDAAAKAESDAKNKAERERVEAEEKAEYERQQAEAAAAKEEALRPDREKLLMFGLGITRQIEAAPVLKQPEVQEALDDVITLLDQAAGICLKAGEGEEQADV